MNYAERLGIVAATVRLDGRAAYDRLATHATVLVVDLSGEWVRRALVDDPELLNGMPAVVDVHLNDVYWNHAGLTR